MEITNLGQLFEHLATKAGIAVDDKNLINVLSNAELSKITVNSDLVKSIDESLLSLDTALDNHPTLKNRYKAETLNALDREIETVLEDSELPDDKVAEIKAIKSSYKRVGAAIAAVKAQAAEKGKGASQEDKSALQRQVDELLGKLQTADSTRDSEITTLKEQTAKKLSDFALANLLSTKKTIYDELPPKTRMAALMEHLDKGLQDKKAAFVLDESDTLTLKGEGDTAVVGANHTPYTSASFIDEILAQNKLLKVSEPPKHPAETTGGRTTVAAATTGLNGNNQTANLNRRNREAAEKNMASQG